MDADYFKIIKPQALFRSWFTSEMERDAFMDGINAGYEPNPGLMKEYHYPLENQKQIKVDVDSQLDEESSDSDGEKRVGSDAGESQRNK